ncbi:MAG: hypothetical protein OXE96_16200 [Gemmatimonadetes bacterium]|nr:hypothetical protein [Gemmatimonadota bacterium]
MSTRFQRQEITSHGLGEWEDVAEEKMRRSLATTYTDVDAAVRHLRDLRGTLRTGFFRFRVRPAPKGGQQENT